MMAWIEQRQTSRGTRYYVYWRDSAGVRQCKKAGSLKKVANRIRDEMETGNALQGAGLPNSEFTFQDLYDSYIKESRATKSPLTVNYLEHALKVFLEKFKFQKVAHINNPMIESYKSQLLAKWKVNGVKIKLKALKSCFQFGVRKGWIHVNPCVGVDNLKAEPVARFLRKDEIQALLTVGCKFNPELRKVIKIVLYTGLRRSELLEVLKDPKKHISGGSIGVQAKKGSNPRMIPLHPEIAKDVGGLKKWTRDRLERAFRRAAKRAKLGRVRFHDLRHTFCSNYLQSGGTIADLRLITGHKSLQALQIYTHFQPSYLKQRIFEMRWI